jgi:hypothetical protein
MNVNGKGTNLILLLKRLLVRWDTHAPFSSSFSVGDLEAFLCASLVSILLCIGSSIRRRKIRDKREKRNEKE